MAPNPEYASFLIRLWREPQADADWLAQVEFIPSGEQRYFASLDELFDFIRDQLTVSDDQSTQPDLQIRADERT
jgi:hypothetical protein